MLETGDLIFVKDPSDMGQAIQASTGNYSHVAFTQMEPVFTVPNILHPSYPFLRPFL